MYFYTQHQTKKVIFFVRKQKGNDVSANLPDVSKVLGDSRDDLLLKLLRNADF